MNRLEAFLIEHILPHSPLGTTDFYPGMAVKAEAEQTAEDIKTHGSVHFYPDTNSFSVPTGATATFSVDGETVTVQDYRDRPGHTPGAKVITKDGSYTMDPEVVILRLATWVFKYFNK